MEVFLTAIESLGQRTSYLERALNTGVSLEASRRADNGAQWAYESYRVRCRHNARLFRRGTYIVDGHCILISKPEHDFLSERRG